MATLEFNKRLFESRRSFITLDYLRYASGMFDSVLYFIWFLLPAIFFAAALWSKMEALPKSDGRSGAAKDFLRQGLFVLACVLIVVIIDKSLIPAASKAIASIIPVEYVRVVLLPAVLYAAARVYGPSAAIKIGPASRFGRRRDNK